MANNPIRIVSTPGGSLTIIEEPRSNGTTNVRVIDAWCNRCSRSGLPIRIGEGYSCTCGNQISLRTPKLGEMCIIR
jgi:hypothetical protein